MPIGKFMISRCTTVTSKYWVRYPIWRRIYILLGTRGYPRSEWISKYPHMPGLYERIWASRIYWNERNYIRLDRTMGFWKLFCSVWASKNDCCGCRWTFSGIFKKTFQETLLMPVHAVTRRNHKKIINEVFHRYLIKVQKIKSEDKGSLHQWLQRRILCAVCLECSHSRRNWYWLIRSGYRQRVPIYYWPITSKVEGGYSRRTTSLG